MAATNGERLAALETGLDYIKNKVDHIDQRIDSFLQLLSDKYAEKEELRDLKKHISELEDKVQKNREFNIKITAGIGVGIVLLELALKFLL